MSRTHRIDQVYTGGGPNTLSGSRNHVGSAEVNFDQAITAGPSTTVTLNPQLILDPDTDILCYVMKCTGGDCTVHFDGSSTATTDVTVALTDGQPLIVEEPADGGVISGLPTASDTYTIKVRNANSTTIGFEARFLRE